MSFEFPTETVKEGKVGILAPKLEAFVKEPWEYAPSKAPVFYNPAMELNRDIAVLALQTYQKETDKEIEACEPLAGCGVRGIRLATEVERVRSIVINDISPEAAKLADFNVKLNNLDKAVKVANLDANLLLSQFATPRRRFNYIDVDPFGSPTPYLDSALRALQDSGLLALTATDMAPLCGVHAKACVRKYGGKPLHTEYCHELAVRLLIGCLATTAAKHDTGVQPIFSYGEYNYVRTYARMSYGAKEADKCLLNLGYVLHCFSCFHRESQKGIFQPSKQVCPECGSGMQAAGPLWVGPLWDTKFCDTMKYEVNKRNLHNRAKIFQMILTILGEANAPITYHVVDKICDKFNLPIPPLSRIIGELRKAGSPAVTTHFNSRGIRTDASAYALRQIVARLGDRGLEDKKPL